MIRTVWSGDTPTTLSVVAARKRLTEGMPAVPMETSVAISAIVKYMPKVIGKPSACAANRAIRP